MKLATRISIAFNDLTDLKAINEAHALLGGDGWHDEVGICHDKVFARIQANDFTLDDADTAIGVLKRRAADVIANAQDRSKCGIVFANGERGYEIWRDGIIANANLAVSRTESFRTDLMLDLAAALDNMKISGANAVRAARQVRFVATDLHIPLEDRVALLFLANGVERTVIAAVSGILG